MLRTETFRIHGMMCRQCEKTLEHAVGRMKGVHSVKADYEAGTLKVKFEDTLCKKDRIEQMIEQTGYMYAVYGSEYVESGAICPQDTGLSSQIPSAYGRKKKGRGFILLRTSKRTHALRTAAVNAAFGDCISKYAERRIIYVLLLHGYGSTDAVLWSGCHIIESEVAGKNNACRCSTDLWLFFIYDTE